MKDKFQELIELIERSLEKDPWLKERNLEKHKKELLSEAKEVVMAIDKKDYTNLKEELGDLLYDVLVASFIAQRDGFFKKEEILQEIIDKVKRRKPFLFWNKRVSKEEALRIWFEKKKQEKEELEKFKNKR